jgi:signal transduction histidine kinase
MGVRGRLLLLVLLPTIPALILAVYTNLELRRFGRAKAEKDAIRVVQLAALKQQALVDAARQHLTAVATIPDAVHGTNSPTYQLFFANFKKLYNDFTDFGLLETNGRLVACSYPPELATNYSQRRFFQQVIETRSFCFDSLAPHSNGASSSVVFGLPVFNSRHDLVRVLYAALDPAAIDRALAKTRIPSGWQAAVMDAQGQILAGSAGLENDVGERFAESSVIGMIRSQKEGTMELHLPANVLRLCAFTSVAGGPAEPALYLVAKIPMSVAFAEPHRILLLNLIVIGVVAALAFGAAWFYANVHLLRPLRALDQTTRRMTDGDLGARTGIGPAPGELNQLAHAFDNMAESLQAQLLQNERLNAELEDRVKQRTAELEQSNQELEAFSYSVSHDLRAPLRHIHGHVGRLQDQAGPALGGEEARLLKLISDAAKRMGILIDDLLAFSRMGRVELSRIRVNMDELVNEVVSEISRDTNGRVIRWSVEPLPAVDADRALLRQVWLNLLSNAVKYTRECENAQIRVSARRERDEFEFQVRDNGAGFDMRYAHKLFRVFERLHRPEEFEGTGIGLANVRRIIHRHGGRTWAEGQVNAGASFYFTLPVPTQTRAAVGDEKNTSSRT